MVVLTKFLSPSSSGRFMVLLSSAIANLFFPKACHCLFCACVFQMSCNIKSHQVDVNKLHFTRLFKN